MIERVEIYDWIGRSRFVTRYAYHHGYFDGVEREYRGFAMVEQLDTETFDQAPSSGPGSVPAVHYAPPSSESPNAAAATSPRSPSPAACSPSATTAYATARSAACKLRGRRPRVPSRRRHDRPSTT